MEGVEGRKGDRYFSIPLIVVWPLEKQPAPFSSPAHPLADIFHPPCPPIASQSISRDVPFARAREVRDRALREQLGHTENMSV